MMTYKPKIGDAVRHWNCWESRCEYLCLDGVVIGIYDNCGDCLVRFEDGTETRIYTDDLKLISKSEPSIDVLKRSKTMNYEPKLGDIVNWTTLDIDGVVREIYDNKECRVYFEDGSERRISTDDMKFISKSEPPSEPSIDVLKRSKTMTYKPEIGDAVNWTNWDIDGVVREICDNKKCRVGFEDGEEMHLPISYLTFISRPEPSPCTIHRCVKRCNAMPPNGDESMMCGSSPSLNTQQPQPLKEIHDDK